MPADAQAVLDLGCGDGVLLERIGVRAPGARLIGVDMSAEDLALAARRLPDATWHEARAQALPLADGAVDVVVSHMALMLMNDVDQVMAELRRVLRPGGRLAVVVSGGMGERGDAIAHYVQLYSALRAQEGGARARIGEGALRDHDSLRAHLTAGFTDLVLEDFVVRGRGDLEAAWTHVGLMYNTELLSAAGRDRLEADFRREATALADAAGQLHFTTGMCLVTARRLP